MTTSMQTARSRLSLHRREPSHAGQYRTVVVIANGTGQGHAREVSNALRHFDTTDEPDFIADLEEAACWMLVRACENAHRLGLTVQGFDAFNDWFHEHVVGT